MCRKTAEEFTLLWTELGSTYKDVSEEELIEKEEHLFRLKYQLEVTDISYIIQHVNQAQMIQGTLLNFLRS